MTESLGQGASFRREALRVVLPNLLLVLLVAGAAFGLVRDYTLTVDGLESERTRRALHAAIELQLEAMEALVHDNAYWNDMARASYVSQALTPFFEESFAYVTRDGRGYDVALQLRADGTPRLGYAGGAPLPAERIARPSADQLAMRSRLPDLPHAASGLLRAGDRLFFVGRDVVLPESAELAATVPAAGPDILVFAKEVGAEELESLERTLQVKGLRLAFDPPTDRAHALRLPRDDGEPLAWLTWTGTPVGQRALAELLPWLAGVGALLLLLGLAGVRKAWRQAEELARQALLDGLSGLPNRRAIRDALGRGLLGGGSVTVAMLDLDGFKAVNDNYGHMAGDHLLLAFARRLTAICGADGQVGRLGGDEFAVVVSGPNSLARGQDIARRLLAVLEEPFRIGEITLSIGSSIGLAHGTLGEADASELLRRADVAMYAAKRGGRGQMVVYSDVHDQRQADAHRIEQELRDALKTGGFELVYQPLMDASGRRIVAVEALLRWSSPSLGRVSPAVFIPVAEETGLINAIGLFVLERACRDALPWAPLRLAVNVSAAQLRNPELAEEIAAILARTGFPAARLELELTETCLVEDADRAAAMLDRIRALGVRLSLDDFGTGYASIGFLRRFAFDKVKIDRSLVEEAVQRPQRVTILEATARIASALDIEVVAEGIETDAHLQVARRVGCCALQGWLFHSARSAEAIAELLGRQEAEGGEPAVDAPGVRRYGPRSLTGWS
ncbi:putative bifunctional diguanylate cyclase/phosphodiesterase [Thermaurantiacus tibetensis]|uniref:putative bifunctional diguanylate cyclase/phosphodiesterase n=1 Tax=Thermaurantiacus tibetensis TaxID=2759035 RepID=UPI00188F4503|nr:bifunctional diguanylate cyclase/phosphodiesterase [Thermaurantiacus tibetensis]